MITTSRHHIYLYKNRLYVPRLARTDAGFYLEQEPVSSVEPAPAELRVLLESRIREGNPVTAAPMRKEYPSLPRVVRAAGARTARAFEREARLWAVELTSNRMKLEALERHPDGGWVQPQRAQEFPSTSEGMDALVSTILKDA
ncbi:MAG: hypothetical protein DMF98_06605 [Acidobacteria bacterium]|nr:MAG: hypothetical protein DMF98_06605 [Acidobacteriota bacterium]